MSSILEAAHHSNFLPLPAYRLDASADAPGWRDANGTRCKRPPTPLPYSTSDGEAGLLEKTAGDEGKVGTAAEKEILFPGEWSVVEGAIRAVATALIKAEPVGTWSLGRGWRVENAGVWSWFSTTRCLFLLGFFLVERFEKDGGGLRLTDRTLESV